ADEPVGAPVALNVGGGRRVTDELGEATFTVKAPGGTNYGTVTLEIRDHDVLREARAQIHVQPFEIAIDPKGLALGPDDRAVLRHLFGPRFRRVAIRKQFRGGLGRARVLLVEPSLA